MNREQALALLNKHSSADESWRDHCLQVSATARRLAEMIARRGHSLDVERTEVLGLVHDLGRSRGHTIRHGVEGYLLLRREGHSDEGRICLAHILKGRSLEQAVRLGMLTERERLDLIENGWQPGLLSLEEKIVVVADAMTSDAGLSSIQEKYDNARRRYGAQLHLDEDEAWAKRLADELSPLLGAHPYAALKDTEDDG